MLLFKPIFSFEAASRSGLNMAKQHRSSDPKTHGGSDANQSQSAAANPAIDASNPMQMSQLPGAGNSYALGLVQAKANRDLESQDVVADAQTGVKGSGSELPFSDQIQASFGHHDVSGVQAHTGSDAKAATSAIGAEAYATGSDIAFGNSPDLHTAAHEAAHVVQQRSGVSLQGGVGQVGDKYEQHADAVADQVVQGKSAEGLLDKHSSGNQAGDTASGDVQMFFDLGWGETDENVLPHVRGKANRMRNDAWSFYEASPDEGHASEALYELYSQLHDFAEAINQGVEDAILIRDLMDGYGEVSSTMNALRSDRSYANAQAAAGAWGGFMPAFGRGLSRVTGVSQFADFFAGCNAAFFGGIVAAGWQNFNKANDCDIVQDPGNGCD